MESSATLHGSVPCRYQWKTRGRKFPTGGFVVLGSVGLVKIELDHRCPVGGLEIRGWPALHRGCRQAADASFPQLPLPWHGHKFKAGHSRWIGVRPGRTRSTVGTWSRLWLRGPSGASGGVSIRIPLLAPLCFHHGPLGNMGGIPRHRRPIDDEPPLSPTPHSGNLYPTEDLDPVIP